MTRETNMQLTKLEQNILTHTRINIERAIVRTIIEDALDMGLLVTHNDGEAVTSSVRVLGDDEVDGIPGRTKEQATNAIMKHIQSTDEEYLIIKEWRGLDKPRRIGSVYLVYGNDGHDVIADHTDSEEMDRILSGAFELSEKLEEHPELSNNA